MSFWIGLHVVSEKTRARNTCGSGDSDVVVGGGLDRCGGGGSSGGAAERASELLKLFRVQSFIIM